jgi:hypothetical protein
VIFVRSAAVAAGAAVTESSAIAVIAAARQRRLMLSMAWILAADPYAEITSTQGDTHLAPPVACARCELPTSSP